MTDQPSALVLNETAGVPGVRNETVVPPSGAFEGQDWFGMVRQLGRVAEETRLTAGAMQVPLEEGAGYFQPEPTEPLLSPTEATKQFGLPGHLKFSSSIPASAAQMMLDAKHEELAREDAAARTPPDILSGAARMGVGLMAGLLDPVNLAASAVPIVGEARLAGVLARAGLEGAALRLGTRVAAGALSGGLAQVPLSGLRYGLSQAEQSDYGMMDAAADVLMGAAGGALLHPLLSIGRPLDLPELRAAAENPSLNEAAGRVAVAQAMDDRPVDVAPVLDAATGHWGAESAAAWERSVQQAANPTSDEAVAAIRQANEAAPLAKPLAAEHAPAPKPEELAPLEAWAKQMREPVEEGGTRTPLTGMSDVRAELDALDKAQTNVAGDATARKTAAACFEGGA